MLCTAIVNYIFQQTSEFAEEIREILAQAATVAEFARRLVFHAF